LNRAWQRRYVSWEDVSPGWAANRPFTEAMAFQHFLTERANDHARKRYETIKAVDAVHPITMHGGAPSMYYCGRDQEGQIITPIDNGNDWDMASYLDGVGCSSFPKWGRQDWSDYAVRMEIIRSAAGKKRLWLSELQGGRAAVGFTQQGPVQAVEQQHWLWNAIAVGAEAILFWCWKDEVFTTEAGGFGMSGFDGYAAERLAAFKAASGVLEKHKDVLVKYRPDRPEIGLYFSPQSAYLHWCNNKSGETYLNALLGYGKALVRKNIPFEMIEEEHLDELKRLKVLFMPRALVTDEKTEKKLIDYVSGGGTLVVESECGAFDSRGIYRYPENRFLNKLGIREVGRRTIDRKTVKFQVVANKRRFDLTGSQWVTPWLFGPSSPVQPSQSAAADRVGQALWLRRVPPRLHRGQTWAKYGKETMAGEVAAGKGRIILIGTYLGETYFKERNRRLEDFLKMICLRSGFCREAEAIADRKGDVYLREGKSGGKRVFFVFCGLKGKIVTIKMSRDYLRSQILTDLISGKMTKGMGVKDKNAAVFKCKIPKERMLAFTEV